VLLIGRLPNLSVSHSSCSSCLWVFLVSRWSFRDLSPWVAVANCVREEVGEVLMGQEVEHVGSVV
jgi:hypothetical protein